MDFRKKLAEFLGLSEVPKGSGYEGFTTEQLKQAETKLRDTLPDLRTARDLTGFRAAVETIEALTAEVNTRTDTEARENAELEELANRITVSDPEPTPDPEPAPEPSPDPSPDPAPTADPPSDPPALAPTTPAPESVPVTAGAGPNDPAPTKPKPVPAPSAITRDDPPPIRLLASGDVEGHTAGATLDFDALGPAYKAKADAAWVGRSKGRWGVATMQWDYPSDRILRHTDSVEANMAKISEVVASAQEETARNLRALLASDGYSEDIQTLLAEGGLCAPVNVRYDILTVGTEARPLRDSFTRFGATRGGIRFNAPPTLVSVAGAVNIYTEAQDTTGTAYPKGCIRVDCGADTEVAVSAITLCMEVGNYNRLFYPENFRAWWGLGRVQHSREAEENLWSRMETLSTAVTAGEGLGAVPNILSTLDRAMSQYRWRHRILPTTPLRLRTQAWVRDLMRADLARRMPGDSTLSATDADIARFFAARNAAVSFVIDANSPGGTSGDVQMAGGLNPWPDSVEINIAVEGVFLYLDGSELNFGTEIRDFDQIRNNDSGAFFEGFEELAMVGPTPVHLSIDVCPSGAAAALDDYDPCTSGS